MKFGLLAERKFFNATVGAALTVLCGLVLWTIPLGEKWVNTSYDYLFPFGSRTVTNEVVLILMDNEAYDKFQQKRGQPWDRALHAKLFNRLADDGCSLVVFDSFLRSPREPESDKALAAALKRQRRVVLMAEQADSSQPGLESARPILPAEPFLSAAGTNWGVAWLDPDLDLIVRRHWPFPAPGPYPSLPWTAAKQAGANLSTLPSVRWLRYYYGEKGPWTSLSYDFAMMQATNYFRDKIVFIGSQPKTTLPDGEVDEFRIPYSRWTGKSAGGVEILATSFLNLMNDDWLLRSSWWAELLLLLMAGVLVGGGLCLVRGWLACVLGLGAALFAMIAAVLWSFYGSTWFPWLLVTGGQVPCALAWAVTSRWRAEGIVSSYEVAKKPFGKGAYGEVFLAQHKKSREWFAFKKVYLAKFNDPAPYEREFRGITRYVPVSSQHPGLLRVHYVGRDEREGHFFYVMDLGDAQSSGWEKNLASYQPCDLAAVCERAERQRLPVHECVRIGLVLSAALDFLHRQGLIHRDIKPSNIIFVKGQPKFADVGLVAEISRPGQESSWVGTEAYMPPLPEPPGTPAADIYALGVVLYVISAGRKASSFPELSETLLKEADQGEFMRLNKVILKACLPHVGQRYASAAEMHAALQSVRNALDPNPTEEMTQRSAQPSPPTA